MKLWEALKALDENPNKMFKSSEGYGEVTLEYRGGVKFIGIKKTLYGAFISESRDWQEVKRPVPWQEAIEAWANWKTIKCEVGELAFTYNPKKNLTLLDTLDNGHMCLSEITDGTWYIED